MGRLGHYSKLSGQAPQASDCHRRLPTVLRRNKTTAVQGGTVSYYYALAISKFIDFMSLFRQCVCVCFFFLLNNFPLQSLKYATYSCVQLIRTTEEVSYRAVFCCKHFEVQRF